MVTCSVASSHYTCPCCVRCVLCVVSVCVCNMCIVYCLLFGVCVCVCVLACPFSHVPLCVDGDVVQGLWMSNRALLAPTVNAPTKSARAPPGHTARLALPCGVCVRQAKCVP